MMVRSKILPLVVATLISIGFVAPTASHAAPNTTKQIKVKQVKKHDTSTDCWSIVNRKVYNLTGWISKHPGGSSRIIAMCGKNASKGFNAQHASAKAPTFNLAKYQIGVVKKKKKR
jgi:cytochrome b involved in lipid metabolism